jgi:hypothetical protein
LGLEPLESRDLLSISGVLPHVAGMNLVDSDLNNLRGQVVYLDTDGAKGVDYRGPATVPNLDVPAFKANGLFVGKEHAIIDQVLAELNTTFAESGVAFTLERPASETPFSTVFIGGTDDAFRQFGSFLALAEDVDVGNRNRGDNAFVFSDELVGATSAYAYARSLAEIIEHETGHLLGLKHANEVADAGVLANVALSAPTATTPGTASDTGYTVGSLTPALQWTAVTGANYYALAISRYPYGSSNIVYNPQQVYGTSITVPTGILQAGTKYRWNMQAHNSAGQWSSISNTLYFQTQATALPAPTINTPGDTSSPGSVLTTLTPQFTWNTVGGATGYGLYIRDMTTNTVVFSNNGGVKTGTSYVLPSGYLTAGHSYRWAMTSFNGSVEGSQGSYRYFQTPGAVTPTFNTAFLSDSQLEDYTSMTSDQVRTFLADHGSYFRQQIADVDGQTFDPSAVITQAATQYHINPKVLLATLQKESQGVTRTTRPSDTMMSLLMGAGTATTARAQLLEAARLFRAYQDELTNTGVSRSGWSVGVAKTTVDGVAVTPATRAVAGQFTYTPYAGAQWGGNDSRWGGVYLFYNYWNEFGFSNAVAAPQPPTNVAATDGTYTDKVRVTWTASANATGCEVWRSASNTTGAATKISTSDVTGTTFDDATATAGTTYWYWIKAKNSTGTSNFSAADSGNRAIISGPVNNNFANRTPISGTTATLTGSNVGATKETGEPNHYGNSGGKSVWWSWTAPSSGSIQIDTIGSNFDTIMGVYTGSSVSTLTMVASDDDNGGNMTSKVRFNAVAGTVYQIAVDGYNYGSGAASGNIVLHVSLTPVAAPVLNVSATSLTLPTTTQGTAGAATSFTATGSGLSANASVTVVAPSGCQISLNGSSGFANMLTLSANGSGTLPSTQIYARISASATTNVSGVVSLNDSIDNCSKLLPASGSVTPVSGPANNNFANRTSVTGTSATMTSTNVGATKETGEPNHYGNSGGKSVWWSWTAPSNGSVQIDTIGSSFDTIMGVYTGSSVSALTTVAGDDDNGGNMTSKVRFNAVAGTVYQIAVDGYNYGSGAASGNIVLHVSLSTTIYDGTTPAPGTTNTNASQPITAPVQNSTSARSVANYNNVINQFAVQSNPRYAQRDSDGDGRTDTFCNIFAWDVTRAMNAEIPHWYDPATGNATAVGVGYEMNATRMLDWLRAFGTRNGWYRLQTAQAAQDLANAGQPTIVIGNGGQNSGHVAVVRPGQVTSLGPSTAQAGRINFNQRHVYDGFFGGTEANYVEYWGHA